MSWIVLFTTLTVAFMISTHSLVLVLLLIMIVICMLMIMTSMTLNWSLYILMLVYVGGMLVIFAYVTSMAPNVHLSVSITTLAILATCMLLSMVKVMDPVFMLLELPQYDSLWFTKMVYFLVGPMVMVMYILLVLYVSVTFISNMKLPMRML